MKKLTLILTLLVSIGYSQVTPIPQNVWQRAGNKLGNNTSFIGSTDNRSLVMKTYTNTGYMKFDSLMNLSIKQSSTNLYNFQPWPAATTLPAFWIGITTPTTTNYAVLGDGTNNYFNSGGTWYGRANNTTWLQASTTQTTNGAVIDLFPPTATMGANQNIINLRLNSATTTWNVGTTATQRNIYFPVQTYSALTTATITDAVGIENVVPSAGTGMTFTRAWGLRSTGNTNLTGNLIVGSALTTTPVATLDTRGTMSVSSTSSLNGITNTGGITTSTTFSAGTTGAFTGNVTLPHIIGGSSAPTIASGSGLGTGAGTVVSVTRATDIAGIIGVVTGTASLGTAATLAAITYNVAYGAAPHVILTPANQAAADLIIGTNIFVGTTATNSFAVTTNTVALTASATYSWFYHVVQ